MDFCNMNVLTLKQALNYVFWDISIFWCNKKIWNLWNNSIFYDQCTLPYQRREKCHMQTV